MRDRTTIIASGCSLVAKVFPGRHQGVEAMLESDDLQSHVTGGEDENSHSAGTYKQGDG